MKCVCIGKADPVYGMRLHRENFGGEDGYV